MKTEEIRKEFNRFWNAPFPPSARGEEIEGVELVLIDADTMGLISRFLGNNGRLEIYERKMLQSCVGDLNTILPHMEGTPKTYFNTLLQLANEVLHTSK